MLTLEEKRCILKKYLIDEGFFVNDGIKYGLDFLAYTDNPDKVHSKYGLFVFNGESYQKLILYQRICRSNNKILLIAFVNHNGSIHLIEVERFTSDQEISNE